MSKYKNQKESLKKGEKQRNQSSMNERWMEDAKWFREDAKKHPEKYQPKNDEKRVSSDELEEYLNDFIREGNRQYSTNEGRSFINPRLRRVNLNRARVRKMRRNRNK